MIPERQITAWQPNAPWLTVEQIEQDLVLSRLIIEIANDPYLGDELVFRGGTCLTLSVPEGYDIDSAAALISTRLLARLDEHTS